MRYLSACIAYRRALYHRLLRLHLVTFRRYMWSSFPACRIQSTFQHNRTHHCIKSCPILPRSSPTLHMKHCRKMIDDGNLPVLSIPALSKPTPSGRFLITSQIKQALQVKLIAAGRVLGRGFVTRCGMLVTTDTSPSGAWNVTCGEWVTW